ncbi:MAG: hypothetical protein JNJ45_11325 [Chthonomonas sp.]|nr:hypothetical protein [Chthonomonas sp.]
MSFVDRVAANPLGCVGGCLVWIPIGIWIYLAINWMIMGELEVLPGIFCICVAFSLGYFTANPPTPALGFVFMGTSVASLLAIPIIKSLTHARAMGSIHQDQIRGYCDTLRQRPNPGTEFRVAASVWDTGDMRRAIAIGARVIPDLHKAHFSQEHREFEHWQMRGHIRADSLSGETQVCTKCGATTNLSAIFCASCGDTLVLHSVTNSSAGLVARLMLGWAITVGLIVGLPIVVVKLPGLAAIPVIVLVVAGAAYALVRLLGREVST